MRERQLAFDIRLCTVLCFCVKFCGFWVNYLLLQLFNLKKEIVIAIVYPSLSVQMYFIHPMNSRNREVSANVSGMCSDACIEILMQQSQ